MSHEIKIQGIVDLLYEDMKMSPMDFFLATIGPNPAFRNDQIGFHKSKGLNHFLNVVQSHPQGRTNLDMWMRPRAIEMVEKRVSAEMDGLKEDLCMSMLDVTPEFLVNFNLKRDLTDLFVAKSPWLRRVLMASCQTSRAVNNNTYKTPDAVCRARCPKSRCH